MAHIDRHGGGCCGVKHICGFLGTETAGDIRRLIAKAGPNDGQQCQLFEVVLTNAQLLRYSNLLPALRSVGFTQVSKFINVNSGNVCNVFHYIPYPLPFVDSDHPERKLSIFRRVWQAIGG